MLEQRQPGSRSQWCIAPNGVTIDGSALHRAGPVAAFHSLFGQPSHVVPVGPPSPAGHRNNRVHYYDDLGITLNEHHYTFQIQEISAVLSTEAIHATTSPFAGVLEIGGVRIAAGAFESDLKGTTLRFVSYLPGVWAADVLSAPTDGCVINVSFESQGGKLPSGGRTKKRAILRVSLSLEHDPWDTTYRPT